MPTPAPKTYRVDYAHDDQPSNPFVFSGLSRKAAMAKAAKASGRPNVGIAYAIARDGDTGQDAGQRVYSGGSFSHQDGEF